MRDLLAAYYGQRRAIPIPTDGLVYYHSLSRVGRAEVAPADAEETWGNYAFEQAVVGDIPCLRNSAEDKTTNFLLAYGASAGEATQGRTSSAMVRFTSVLPAGNNWEQIVVQRLATNSRGDDITHGGSMSSKLMNAYNSTRASTEWQVTYSQTWAAGRWYAVSYTMDPATDTAALYLDGARKAQKTGAGIWFGRRFGLTVGQRSPALACIARASVYSRALTAAEIADLHTRMKTP